MFLVAFSKWLDAKLIKRVTFSSNITALRSIFATHGIPELLVYDNGSVFTSDEFKDFLKQNGIRHNTSAPCHPASNGLAERNVQTFKEKEEALNFSYFIASPLMLQQALLRLSF